MAANGRAIGNVVGAAGGLSSASDGAAIGRTVGMVVCPAGMVLGPVAGGLLGGLLGGAAGCASGAAVGQVVEEHVLDNHHCLDCDHSFSLPVTPWHGLGNQLTTHQPLQVWAKQASMDWDVRETPVRFITESVGTLGAIQSFPDHKVLFRSDISVVSQRFQVGSET